MDADALRDWLDRYADAWEAGDPDAAAALFVQDGEYHLTPFEAMEGRGEIRDYWADAAADEVSVDVEVLAVADGRGIGRFHAEYADGAVTDGLCIVELDGDRCTVFREWWHKRG